MNILEGIFWLFLTVYHEARGEPPAGQRAVVKVILNRATKNNWPISSITLARKQFSCYNFGLTSQSLKILDIPAFIKVADNVVWGIKEWESGDNLKGATHYYAIAGMVNHKPPYWAGDMEFITEIEGHRFYKES